MDDMDADTKKPQEEVEDLRRADAERIAARYNDRSKLTARHLELGQHVRDLYASGARLWTKDMLRDAEVELAKVPRPEAAMVQSMDGTKRSVPFPDIQPYKSTEEESHSDDDLVYGPWEIGPDFKAYDYLADYAERKYEDDESPSTSATEEELFDVSCALVFSISRTSYPKGKHHFDDLKAVWDETWANWTKTTAYKQIVDTITSIPHIPKSVSKIICFGLGPMEVSWNLGDNGQEILSAQDDMPVRRTMTQHAAALTMATNFGAKVGKGPLKIFAQDPAYSEADKELLGVLGIEVVEGFGALGFTYVDEDTVVYSIAPNVPVKEIVADIARPAAMVWNKVKPAKTEKRRWRVEQICGSWTCVGPWFTDPDSPRTRELVESYRVYEFPDDQDRFGDLSIYIRSD